MMLCLIYINSPIRKSLLYKYNLIFLHIIINKDLKYICSELFTKLCIKKVKYLYIVILCLSCKSYYLL